MKVLKNVVNIILVFVIVISILLLTSFVSVKENLNLSTSSSSSSNSSSDSLYLDEEMMSKLSKKNTITVEKVHKYGDEELDKRNIPRIVLDYVLKEDDYVEMFYRFKSECINYFAGLREKPTVPRERIYAMTERGIAKYNSENEEKVSYEKVKKDIEDYLEKIEDKITKIGENGGVKLAFKILRSNIVNYTCIIVIVICLIVLIVINKPLLGGLFIGLSSLSSGIMLAISKIIINSNYIKDILNSEITSVQSDFNKYGIILIIIGIILIASTTIYKKLKGKNSEGTVQ